MNDDKEVTKYLNTLIYLIIIKAIAILSLLLLLFQFGEAMSYMIITYQLGLLCIILFVVWKITHLNKKSKEMKEAAKKSPVILDNCPNYFVRTTDEDDNTMCINSYTTADGKYEYVFEEASTDSINITDIQSTNENMEALCNLADNYASYPWTEFKAKCDKL